MLNQKILINVKVPMPKLVDIVRLTIAKNTILMKELVIYVNLISLTKIHFAIPALTTALIKISIFVNFVVTNLKYQLKETNALV